MESPHQPYFIQQLISYDLIVIHAIGTHVFTAIVAILLKKHVLQACPIFNSSALPEVTLQLQNTEKKKVGLKKLVTSVGIRE